jgi:pSer/pThr/pTyr-binding forkhead associated (FHA) protein
MNQSSQKTAVLGICSERFEMIEVPLHPGITIIGRKPHLYPSSAAEVSRKHLTLCHDADISRVHLKIVYLPDLNKLTLEDLNSLNGTYINGARIEDTTQIDADTRIEIGRTSIIFLVDPAVTPLKGQQGGQSE